MTELYITAASDTPSGKCEWSDEKPTVMHVSQWYSIVVLWEVFLGNMNSYDLS